MSNQHRAGLRRTTPYQVMHLGLTGGLFGAILLGSLHPSPAQQPSPPADAVTETEPAKTSQAKFHKKVAADFATFHAAKASTDADEAAAYKQFAQSVYELWPYRDSLIVEAAQLALQAAQRTTEAYFAGAATRDEAVAAWLHLCDHFPGTQESDEALVRARSLVMNTTGPEKTQDIEQMKALIIRLANRPGPPSAPVLRAESALIWMHESIDEQIALASRLQETLAQRQALPWMQAHLITPYPTETPERFLLRIEEYLIDLPAVQADVARDVAYLAGRKAELVALRARLAELRAAPNPESAPPSLTSPNVLQDGVEPAAPAEPPSSATATAPAEAEPHEAETGLIVEASSTAEIAPSVDGETLGETDSIAAAEPDMESEAVVAAAPVVETSPLVETPPAADADETALSVEVPAEEATLTVWKPAIVVRASSTGEPPAPTEIVFAAPEPAAPVAQIEPAALAIESAELEPQKSASRSELAQNPSQRVIIPSRSQFQSPPSEPDTAPSDRRLRRIFRRR